MIPTLHVEDSGVPIYVQIRDQFLRAIGSGSLRPGEQMPTMRQVAISLRVDLNTVRHAYDELEETGAVVILRARGTFVADKPPPLDPARQSRRVDSLAQQVIALSTTAGLDPVEVARQIIAISKQQGARK